MLEAALMIGALCDGVWSYKPQVYPDVAGRLAAGFAADLLGFALMVAFAHTIAETATDLCQEVFSASIFTAVGMLGWHNISVGITSRLA